MVRQGFRRDFLVSMETVQTMGHIGSVMLNNVALERCSRAVSYLLKCCVGLLLSTLGLPDWSNIVEEQIMDMVPFCGG